MRFTILYHFASRLANNTVISFSRLFTLYCCAATIRLTGFDYQSAFQMVPALIHRPLFHATFLTMDSRRAIIAAQ